MFSQANYSLKKWLFISVLIYSTSYAFPDSSGDKKMNLKIGFDLIQGENGAPSLRIRDFEDSSEFKQRALDDEAVMRKKTSPSVRADSDSDSIEIASKDAPARFESSKEQDRSDDDSNDSDRKLSTRGLIPEEYEPEESPRIHHKYQESSESDSDRPRHRGKRNIHLKGLVEKLKNKSREFFSVQRRQGVSIP